MRNTRYFLISTNIDFQAMCFISMQVKGREQWLQSGRQSWTEALLLWRCFCTQSTLWIVLCAFHPLLEEYEFE